MFYVLENDVYIVNGAVRSCIYDFKSEKLYSINGLLAEKMNQINNNTFVSEYIDDELTKILDIFISKGILKKSKELELHSINDIKKCTNGCKFAWIEITNKCNLRCKHCYNESDVQCDNIMSLINFKKVIDCLVKMCVPKIQIIGGEPFFDKMVLKNMLDYVVGKFEFIEIFTNGTLINDEKWFSFFKKNNIHIALSVYSYDDKMHDKVTGLNGSFERTNKTIKILKQRGIPYRVCNVLMTEIELGEKNTDLYTLSADKDIVRMSGRANFKLLSDELIRKRLITKKTFQSPIKKTFCQKLISGHNCFRDKIYISANMEVYPCVMERRLKHCKIGNDNQIILDDKIRFLSKDKISECSECEYRYACFDCRPNSLTENIYEKPWYCTYLPKKGIWQDENDFISKLKENWC